MIPNSLDSGGQPLLVNRYHVAGYAADTPRIRRIRPPQKENADYTAIVSGEVHYVDNAPKIFIRPHPYNEHVTFHNFLLKVREIPGELRGTNLFFVVAYQKAPIGEMERLMIPVFPVKPQGVSGRSSKWWRRTSRTAQYCSSAGGARSC
jgi:hypothetical protein